MKRHTLWIAVAWVLGLYIGTYLVLCLLGVFDLARLPWNNQEASFLYLLFLPLEWL